MRLNDAAFARLLDQSDDVDGDCQKAMSAVCAVMVRRRGLNLTIEALTAYAQALAEDRPEPDNAADTTL